MLPVLTLPVAAVAAQNLPGTLSTAASRGIVSYSRSRMDAPHGSGATVITLLVNKLSDADAGLGACE